MDADRLRDIPLFSSLSRDERERVAQWADEVEVGAGKHLADEGDFAHEFFAIEEGTAEVTVRGERVAELGPGDFFGEIALVETERRTASVIATSPMRLIVMFGRDFREMESEIPEIAERITATVRERMKTS
ncbi:MAG TPA: cyclic nucleotide-binding domain-containing protein [Actinomycetota bacterium]|nr:cyclic nucleotide-binding domain-containing protein [Actinomycetota bacterium]